MAINGKYVELLNADGMDNGSIFYGADASSTGGTKITPEQIQQGFNLANQIASTVNSYKTPAQNELKSVCGRRPILFKKKKEAYQKCVDNYLKQKNAAAKPSNPTPNTDDSQKMVRLDSKPAGKKFLGMPIGLGITVSVLALAGIGFCVYKLGFKK